VLSGLQVAQCQRPEADPLQPLDGMADGLAHPLDLPLAALALTGCVVDASHSGPLQYASENVELDNSEEVRIDLRMGAGDLRVSDGAQKLVRADFSYNVPSWKPEVRYSRDGKRGTLKIEQPGRNHSNFGNVRYRWDLQLSNKVPLDVAVHFGAGQARLDLGSLLLRGVEVNMGVGQLDLDLVIEIRKDAVVGEAQARLTRRLDASGETFEQIYRIVQ